MDQTTRELLESLGWTPELLERAKPTEAMKAFERSLCDKTRAALTDAGFDPLSFLASNPRASMVELAKRVNRGATALGLIVSIYEDAITLGIVRETAKDLLLREIMEQFPNGWFTDSAVCASVKLGRWSYHINAHVGDTTCGQYASGIVSAITIDEPPPEGWKPELPSDPFIDDVFDRIWPIDASTKGK
jgi:hypothetical protein